MGVDLTLHPEQFEGRMDWWLATTSLPLSRDYVIWDQIKQVRSNTIPAEVKFQRYEDEGLHTTTEDAYGESLRFCTAGALSVVALPNDSCRWNHAVFAMLRQLEPSTPVVLYWH